MSTNKSLGAYIIQNNETLETYVGSGILSERKKNHFSDLRNNKHCNKKLQEAFNKSSNFDFIGVETDTREEAYQLEQILINDQIDNPLLLNIVLDVNKGVPRGWKHSEETKELLRQQKLGTKASEETKQKLSIAKLGNTNSLGFKHTPETIAKRSASMIGHIVTEETREKMRQAQLGREPAEGTKKYIESTKKPIVANGIEYNSVSDAVRDTGLTTNAVHHRLKSANFKDWYRK